MEKPKYLQIKDIIKKEYILNKTPDTAIPSEREISTIYDASRMTVRRAIEELVEEGYLYREKNVGTFVSAFRERRKNSPVMLDEAHKATTKYKILYFNTYYDVKGLEEIIENLDISQGEVTLRVVRQVLEEETVLCIEDIYIRRKEIPSDDFSDINKYLNFEKYIDEGTIDEVFIPTIVPTQYARLLNIKLNTPIIRIDNLISKKNGVPFIFVQSYYNPDKKKISNHI